MGGQTQEGHRAGGRVHGSDQSRVTCLLLVVHSLVVSDQTEQLQLKLIQEKDLNDQLETEKVAMERQVQCVCVCVCVSVCVFYYIIVVLTLLRPSVT